jgi:hypothetical protein
MTEAEWLACTDLDRMLEYLSGRPPTVRGWLTWLGFRQEEQAEPEPPKVSARKLRLYACASCRQIGGLLIDERSRRAVEVGERHADGLATDEELRAAQSAAWEALNALTVAPMSDAGQSRVTWKLQTRKVTPWLYAARAAVEVVRGAPEGAIAAAVRAALEAATEWGDTKWATQAAGAAVRAALLRELVGNPFRPPELDPAWLEWRGRTVLRIAQAIYDESRFEELPVLADALEEAGCTDADLLAHCRGGEHFRGCWVVDLILSKDR